MQGEVGVVFEMKCAEEGNLMERPRARSLFKRSVDKGLMNRGEKTGEMTAELLMLNCL